MLDGRKYNKDVHVQLCVFVLKKVKYYLTNNRFANPSKRMRVAVDDSELAALGEVGITSAPHPMEKLGKKAAENLLQMIKNPLFDANYEFDVDIAEKDSVLRL